VPRPSRLAPFAAATLLLAGASSCVPVGGATRGYHVSVAIPDPDRSLLSQLALADPLAKPATAPAAGHGGVSPFAAPPPFLTSLASDDGHRAEECLTAAVYYEARSEPVDGQRAVAQVVLNRVRDRAFPPSVCGVVYQHSARGCQFSFACDGSTARAVEPRAWAIARAIADAALGGSVFAGIGAATHYHASYVSPWWAPSLTRIAAVGSHIFYRWRDHLADALSFRQAYSGREGSVTIAAAAPADDAGGVRVIRGGDPADQALGVTVHRGPVEAQAAQADVVPPVPTGATAFGVRVHHGDDGTAGPADTPAPDQH
jgi:spore germination cell wall hydrolase CwlJ-like protein